MTFSFFFNNRVMFGGYPTQEHIDTMENQGDLTIVDLTCKGEKGITPYVLRRPN